MDSILDPVHKIKIRQDNQQRASFAMFSLEERGLGDYHRVGAR
jgi:hypothetical protein